LLTLATKLGSITRLQGMDLSRDTFYRYQSAMESGGRLPATSAEIPAPALRT
jgi:hypothetical protein